MDEARDIVVLTVPFAAGTAALSALSRAAFWSPYTAAYLSLAFLFASSVALIAIICRPSGGRDRSWLSERLPYSALYFAAGAFCFCSASLWPESGTKGMHMAEGAYLRLQSLIDRVPFANEGSAALVKALMTGDRGDLQREVIARFRVSGASHILALSGLHLGVIYLIIKKLFSASGNSEASRVLRCLATVAATGFYTLMTGARPSCVRAWLFISMSEVASICPGRKKSSLSVLMVSLTVQLAVNPAVVADVGFQLSYLAICGMIVLCPWLQGFYPKAVTPAGEYDPMRRIWNAAALTISCQAFTAPVVWNTFHTFPKYFLLTNLLALPLSTAIMGMSVLTIALCALGCCPQFVISADETCIQALLYVLDVISEM